MTLQQLPTQVSALLTLTDAVAEFRLHQRVSRHSAKTLQHYDHSFSKLAAWLVLEGLERVDTLEPRHLRAFLLWLGEAGTLNANSIHGVMRDTRAFFNFLEAEGLILQSPMRRVKMPRLDRTILPAFTEDEIRALERATDGKGPRDVRNRALILLLLDTGLRLNECASLRLGDVDLATGHVKVMGKGRKERVTRLGGRALKAFLRYLRHRGGQTGEPLWVGVRGPMTALGIAETLEKLGKRCLVHAHPHKFRRTCALLMLRSGADVFSVQHLLGHADLAVLRRYLAQTEADVTRVHELHSPVDGLK